MQTTITMRTDNDKPLHITLLLIFSLFLFSPTTWAGSDKQLMEKALMSREGNKHLEHHGSHQSLLESIGQFRGVFYGYLPCNKKNCDGVKMTLSLKQKNKYLLVTQYAKASAREYYDKGKYDWDEDNQIVTLTSKKKGLTQKFRIKNETTLIKLNADGSPLPGNENDYALQRSDSIETREVHMH